MAEFFCPKHGRNAERSDNPAPGVNCTCPPEVLFPNDPEKQAEVRREDELRAQGDWDARVDQSDRRHEE